MSVRRFSAIIATTVATMCPAAWAEVFPLWTAELPTGAALSAGLQAMVVDAAGNSYITGITGPSSNTDILTAAFAPDGTMLWQHVFNGSGNWHDQARGIALGPNGVVYVCGNTPGPGKYANVLLLKYDAASGALLNTVQFSSGPGLSEHGQSVATDAAGNVYVGGGTVGDGGDCLTLKFDAKGQFQWKRVWDGPASAPYSQESVKKLAIDPFGDVVIMTGGVMNTLHPDYVIIKYDPQDGSTIWQANWGVNGGDFPADMEFDAVGDIYVTGTGINLTDQFSTIKLRGSDGQLLWQAYDKLGIDDGAIALALDGNGGVYITGEIDLDGNQSNFNENYYTVKRDAVTGAQLWTHTYGATCVGCFDVPGDVLVDSAGHVFVIGESNSAPYGKDVLLFVLDADTGLEIERGSLSGPPNETADAGLLRFDAKQNLYAGSSFYHVNTGATAMGVVKYSSMTTVPGDLNGDGKVDQQDLGILLATYGLCQGQPGFIAEADIDKDGCVGQSDLGILLANYEG